MMILIYAISFLIVTLAILAFIFKRQYSEYRDTVKARVTWENRTNALYTGKKDGHLFPVFSILRKNVGLTITPGFTKPYTATFDKIFKEPYGLGMRSVEVTYTDGSVIPTSLAEGISDKQIREYFYPGKIFNISMGPDDKIEEVVRVKIVK